MHITLDRIGVGRPARVSTPVYITPEIMKRGGYRMIASPSLYPGQTVTAQVTSDTVSTGSYDVRLYARVFPEYPDSGPGLIYGPAVSLKPGEAAELKWTVPETEGLPIVRVGAACSSESFVSGGLLVDRMTWSGVPTLDFFGPKFAEHHPPAGWTDGVDRIRGGRTSDDSGRVDLI
jgi:hypothetical protein